MGGNNVRIRQVIADSPWPRWHLLIFTGRSGSESKGVVDMIAVRKDHGDPFLSSTRRGDALQIILIQAKGGSAAMPTKDDAVRLRRVARHHGACCTLLAAWKKGTAAQFYSLDGNSKSGGGWSEKMKLKDLKRVFGRRKEAIKTGLG